MRSLLDAPAPAVLTLYRADGETLVSPVWFRVNGDAFEIVVAITDHKLEHLRRDPRCVLVVVVETTPPFRGIEVRADAALSSDGVAPTRPAIASRHPGAEDGRRFAERRGDRGIRAEPAGQVTRRSWAFGRICRPDSAAGHREAH